MITLQEIKQNESIKALVRAGNRYLETLGYTDHGPRHLGYVSRTASGILKSLGYREPRGIQGARGETGRHRRLGTRRGQQRQPPRSRPKRRYFALSPAAGNRHGYRRRNDYHHRRGQP